MYTVDYFIKKFEAIPENKWIEGVFINDNGAACANGHCGARCGVKTEEAIKLSELFKAIKLNHIWNYPNDFGSDPLYYLTANINDGMFIQYQQPTPKQRILAALYDIKKMQQPELKEEKVKTVYVSVPETVKEQAKSLITTN